MYVLAWRTACALTRVLFWCLFPEFRSNEGNKHQNNTRVSAQTVRHKSTYIILFLTWHNESINDGNNEDLQHHPHVSLDRFTCCWWRHNRLAMTSQWPGNCDANTWQVISNSLDIDFIHGDIHSRSCKNKLFIHKNAFENVVCKMAAILPRPHCIKASWLQWFIDWLLWIVTARKEIQGPISISDKTSYHKISWSFEVLRFTRSYDKTDIEMGPRTFAEKLREVDACSGCPDMPIDMLSCYAYFAKYFMNASPAPNNSCTWLKSMCMQTQWWQRISKTQTS